MAFSSKKYISRADANKLSVRYRTTMAKHPFLLFGLPFMSVIVAGSFILTPATAIRYEKHDRRVRQMTQQEEAQIGIEKRKFDMREEYFRLMSKRDIDDWEPKRVKRLPGEGDGRL